MSKPGEQERKKDINGLTEELSISWASDEGTSEDGGLLQRPVLREAKSGAQQGEICLGG